MKHRFTLFIMLGVILLFPLTKVLLSQESSTELRAAIDIGSGATNLKIAKINTKTEKIVSSLFEKSIPVPYQKHLEQSSNDIFDDEVMAQGLESLQTIKKITEDYQVKKVVAVATAAFRKAQNAESFTKKIFQETGIEVKIINQDEEGILAFRGAIATTSAEPKEIVTWDIGGGSMQLTTLSEMGTYIIEKGKTASIPFKNQVIQEIKNQNSQFFQTPNPMSPNEMHKAISLASTIAQKTNSYIKNKILNPNTKILAVGSLFNYGIRPLTNGDSIALEKAIFNMSGKNDSELPGGALAEVAVTNPLLVLGYMKGFGIHEIEIINVNNADGALTFPPYWQ